MQGSPENQADLLSVNIDKCFSVVILSAGGLEFEDQRLTDKDVVLSFMNIRSMEFVENKNVNSKISDKAKIADPAPSLENQNVTVVPNGRLINIITDLCTFLCKRNYDHERK